MDYIEIGRRVLRIRKNLNQTQQAFADRIGISLSFLGHIERGTRVMSIDTLARIAKAGHCSTDYLLGVEAERGRAEEYAADILERALLLVQRKIDADSIQTDKTETD